MSWRVMMPVMRPNSSTRTAGLRRRRRVTSAEPASTSTTGKAASINSPTGEESRSRFEQTLLLQPLVRVVLRQVVLARVADDEDDDAALVCVARDLQSRRELRPRRAAAENSLLASELARHLERVAVCDVDDLINVAHV